METEYPTYKLGLSLKRATWLVEWLRLLARTGKTEAKAFAQGLGRLGFASIALDWERPFLGPLHAYSSAVQGKPGALTLPTMVRVLRVASGPPGVGRQAPEARAATGWRGTPELLHGR